MKILFSVLFSVVSIFFLAQAPQLVIPRGHSGSVILLAISLDKKWPASGDDNGTVKFWNKRGCI